MFGSTDCYDQLLESIEDEVEPLYLEYEAGTATGLRDDFYEKYGKYKLYSDGYMMVIAWKWRIDSVFDEQAAGICLQIDNNESDLSCWEVVKDADSNF